MRSSRASCASRASRRARRAFTSASACAARRHAARCTRIQEGDRPVSVGEETSRVARRGREQARMRTVSSRAAEAARVAASSASLARAASNRRPAMPAALARACASAASARSSAAACAQVGRGPVTRRAPGSEAANGGTTQTERRGAARALRFARRDDAGPAQGSRELVSGHRAAPGLLQGDQCRLRQATRTRR